MTIELDDLRIVWNVLSSNLDYAHRFRKYLQDFGKEKQTPLEGQRLAAHLRTVLSNTTITSTQRDAINKILEDIPKKGIELNGFIKEEEKERNQDKTKTIAAIIDTLENTCSVSTPDFLPKDKKISSGSSISELKASPSSHTPAHEEAATHSTPSEEIIKLLQELKIEESNPIYIDSISHAHLGKGIVLVSAMKYMQTETDKEKRRTIARFFINQKLDTNCVDKDRHDPFYYATILEDIELMSLFLINKSKTGDPQKDFLFLYTPLLDAMKNNLRQATDFIISNEIIKLTQEQLDNLINIAVSRDYKQAVELFKNRSIKMQNSSLWKSILYFECKEKMKETPIDYEYLTNLFKINAISIDKINQDYVETPLMIAAEHNNIALANFLLNYREEYKPSSVVSSHVKRIDINQAQNLGRAFESIGKDVTENPTLRPILTEEKEAVENYNLLTTAFPKQEVPITALVVAARKGHLDTIQFLIERGAKYSIEDFQSLREKALEAKFTERVTHYDKVIEFLKTREESLRKQSEPPSPSPPT